MTAQLRVMATPSPAVGHFFPIVPFLWALRAAGHDVRVVVPAFFAGIVLQSGLPVIATAPALETAAAQTAPGAPEDLEPGTVATYRRLGRVAQMMQSDVDRVVEQWRPHLVISDPMDYAGRRAAAVHALSYVEHWIGQALPEAPLTEAAHDVFGPASKVWPGIAGNPSFAQIDPCPPAFQQPWAAASTHTRYVPYNGPALLPEWLPQRDPDRPRVLITLGTIISQSEEAPQLLSRAVDAAAALGADVVVAGNKKVVPADVVARVHAAQWLPIGLVAQHFDLVVHHGGSGTTMSSLAHGVPQVACPSVLDQDANAMRLEETGTGRRVSHSAALNTHALSEAVEQVLRDAAFTRTAAAMRAQNQSAQPPAEAVQRLLQRFDER
ncbi:glycosyltransferase family 1 protein [Streptomyces sp. G44]|uniref:glycosyltransferase n=1 Tax=Streptomyces sp. G44 TaxID=2807632 RepID=UPI001960666F|nr:glycosyltransferase [Streptomyces sp. G44]MBM7167520.1 glycosyltransferase family 1 protein [Streptomyces sp. G44]